MAGDGQTAPEDHGSTGAGPGVLLRQARERAGLSIDAVAAELLLKPRVLDALERDDFDVLPEPPFVRGYLRSFARLVGADETEVLERYEAVLPSAPETSLTLPTTAETEDRGRLVMLATGSLIVLAVVAVLVWWIGSGGEVTPKAETQSTPPSTELRPPPSLEPPPPPLSLPAPPIEEPPPPPEAEPAVESSAETERPTPTDTVSDAPSTPEVTAPPVAGAEAEPSPRSADQPADTVVVEMLEDSWVEIYDADGRRLVYGLEPAGARRQLRGTRPFRVFLGNASGVKVEINGRPFDLSPLVRRDKTARFTLQ